MTKIKGSVKARKIKQSCGTVEYEVILFRGEEEDLITKLDGDLKNLISFCDNGFKFNDLTARHYGGNITKGYVYDKKIFNTTYTSFVSCKEKPAPDYRIAYRVQVYID